MKSSAKKKAKQPNKMSKRHFVNTLLNEITEVAKTKPYLAFLLVAVFNEFARVELGVNIFKSQQLNKGLHYMTSHYRPVGLWLMSEEKGKRKHMKLEKGVLCVEINKTISEIKLAVSKVKIDNKPFLNI